MEGKLISAFSSAARFERLLSKLVRIQLGRGRKALQKGGELVPIGQLERGGEKRGEEHVLSYTKGTY